ncbi:MAG: hypothetical protein R3F35_14110 [Myxococcota bacterium]
MGRRRLDIAAAWGRAGASRWDALGTAADVTLAVLLLVAMMGVGPPPAAATPPATTTSPLSRTRWQIVNGLPNRGEALTTVASAPHAGLAVGDEGGVSWWHDGAWARAQTPAVRALAFDAAGQLWIGTDEGLFRWPADARPQRRPLRDGEASAQVWRIEAAGDALLVATGSGAYWSSGGRGFQTLNAGSTDQAVRRIVFRRPPGEARRGGASPRLVEVWTHGGEGLVRTRGIEADAGLRIVERIVWPLPRPLVEDAAVDLVLDPARAHLHLVYADAIARLELDAAGGDVRRARWHWLRPVLPPGALIRRLVFGADGTVWLATDHGLHVAGATTAAFVRAASPAGSRDCADVARVDALPAVRPTAMAVSARTVAACRATLLALVADAADPLVDAAPPPDARASRDAIARGRPADVRVGASEGGDGPSPGAVDGASGLPPDPPVAVLRDRALARVGLTVERAEGLWQGLRRRALLPALQLRGGYDVDRARARSRDQSFVSGDTRELFDRDRDLGRGYQASFVLDWELGGLAYPDDAVDLSRELRQVTSLRDDVSDEIHQLYFERQRIRARLAQPDALAPGEAVELRLRAEELEAGLDAWTGGWIGAWRARSDGEQANHPGRSDAAID